MVIGRITYWDDCNEACFLILHKPSRSKHREHSILFLPQPQRIRLPRAEAQRAARAVFGEYIADAPERKNKEKQWSSPRP